MYEALKALNQLQRIINSKEWFILANPERTLLDCQIYLDTVIQTYKVMVQKRKTKNAVIHRNLAIGIPGKEIDV